MTDALHHRIQSGNKQQYAVVFLIFERDRLTVDFDLPQHADNVVLRIVLALQNGRAHGRGHILHGSQAVHRVIGTDGIQVFARQLAVLRQFCQRQAQHFQKDLYR